MEVHAYFDVQVECYLGVVLHLPGLYSTNAIHVLHLLAGKQASQVKLTTTEIVSVVLAACNIVLFLVAVSAHKVTRNREGKTTKGSTTQQEAAQNLLPGIPLRANFFQAPQNAPPVTCSPVSTDKPGEEIYENVDSWVDNACRMADGAWVFDDRKTVTPPQGDRFSEFPEDGFYEDLG